jgi:hypothetical protein
MAKKPLSSLSITTAGPSNTASASQVLPVQQATAKPKKKNKGKQGKKLHQLLEIPQPGVN